MMFNIDVLINSEAIEILSEEKELKVRNTTTGEINSHSYDKLVLAPGAVAVRPPLPGIDLPGIFHVRTVPDAKAINEWIEKGNPFLAGMNKYSGFQAVRPKTRAVVIGGGFIGLETAENLIHRGFEVTLIQNSEHVLTPLDPENSCIIESLLSRNGVKLALGTKVTSFEKSENDTLHVLTKSGKKFTADLVILAIGVRPDTSLAKTAGLEIGERGGIRVNEHMQTSDPHIFAVGDAVEVKDWITKEWSLIALAGPANRQGRIAADVISGRMSKYRGTQGTSIIGLFGGAAAWTGASEKTLKRIGETDYEKVYFYPKSHAGYYPGSKTLAIKILFAKSDGKLLGAQALGFDGVDKRISVIAGMMQMGATIYDLEEAELCYAPQFGSAKDPVNFAGMLAGDVLRGDQPIVHWDHAKDELVLDVRESIELAVENIEGAINIPLGQLRSRLGELPKDRMIHVLCRSGQRAYLATRILLQNGFQVKNISGGMLSQAQNTLLNTNVQEV